ncbi:hypothetical protein KBD81_02905 [Candidatus Woesebacteria bacterium]|nr:hypothetical protein [Candidatus Woesebacteria bacterium]
MKTYTIAGIVIALVVLGLAVIQYVSLQKDMNDKQAIQGCAEVAAKSGTEGNPFNGAIYQVCMQDKGFGTVLK